MGYSIKKASLVFLILLLALQAQADAPSFADVVAAQSDPAAPAYQINVRVAGKQHDGEPKLGVAVDNQTIDSSSISASYLDDDWQDISLAVMPNHQLSQLALELLNGGSKKTNGREIYIKSITVNGVAIPPENGVFQEDTSEASSTIPGQLARSGQMVWNIGGVPQNLPTPPAPTFTNAALSVPIFYETPFASSSPDSLASQAAFGGAGGGSGGSSGSSSSGSGNGSAASSGGIAAVGVAAVATPTVTSSGSSTGTQTPSISYTIAGLAPALLNTLTFGNSSYLQYVPAQSPVAAVVGDVTQQFTAPDGTNVVVTVKSPVATKTYTAPAMTAGTNPLTYFQQQIAAAGSGSTIIFPTATYNFPAINCTDSTQSGYQRAYIFIHDMNDIAIDWQGSTLNLTSDCMGLFIERLTRSSFKNFIIDYPSLNNSAVGVVTASGGTGPASYTYNLQFPAGTVLTGGISVGTAWDAINNYWSLQDPTHEKYITATPVSIVNSTATNIPSGGAQMTVGESILVRHLGVNNAVVVATSQDTTFNNTTIYNSPGLGFIIGTGGRGLHITNSHVDRMPGRPISTMVDAVHFGSFGGDIIIENSSFSYQGDDGLNLHTAFIPVASMSCAQGSCPFTIPTNDAASNGDTIGLFDPQINFLGVRNASCAGTNCTVDVSPIAAAGGYAADLSIATGRFIIQNNTYYHNRARGILVQTPYGLVQNNTFAGQSLFSIYVVQNGPFWHEGPGAEDVIFYNNQISSPGAGGGKAAVTIAAEGNSGVIYNATAALSGVPALPATHQNIIFANNNFSNLPGAAFYVSSANNVILYNNTFSNINLVTSAGTPNLNGTVDIYDASNIFLSGNALVSGGNTSSTLSVLSNTSDGSITGSW